MRRLAFLAGLWVGVAAAAAQAATLVTVEGRREPSGKTDRSVVRLDGGRVRVDLETQRESLVYQKDKKLLWSIDHEERTYSEIDQQSALETAESAAKAEESVRAGAASLPPAARATAEDLLDRTLGPKGKAPKLELRESKLRDTVRGVPCRERELLQDGALIARICEARYEDAGVTREALSPVFELASVAKQAAPLFPPSTRAGAVAALDLLARLEGFPMRVLSYEDGQLTHVAQVTEIAKRPTPPGTFQIPAGYQRGLSLNVRNGIGSSP
jgi:hypothetical protein